MLHRAALFLIFLASLHAQSWDSLRAVQGQHVKVTDSSGATHKGVCQTVSADAITLEGTAAIERGKVRRVEVRSGARRVRNAVIGVAIGVAVGVTVDHTVGTYMRNETGDSARAVTYVAPIALFGGIGAALSGYRTVYRVR